MIIDITKFFIISKEQFSNIIQFLNVTLSEIDDSYMITYIFINFFAYFLIFMCLVISFKIYKILKRKVFKVKCF